LDWDVGKHKQEDIELTGFAALITLLVYLLKKEWKKQFILIDEGDFLNISNSPCFTNFESKTASITT